MGMHQGLDLSRFRKVSNDSRTTTLRHAKGHEITVVHSALTPKMRESLKALPMAEGGEIDADPVDSEVPAKAMDPESPATADDAPSGDSTGDMKQALAEYNADTEAGKTGSIAPSAYTPDEEPQEAPEPVAPTPTMQQLSAEDEAWKQDLRNGHITPETYRSMFAKKDTIGKVGTLFGLLVSGAGSGLAHQQNAVMGMMDREIQNDLDAQKTSKTNANNFWNTAGHLAQGFANAENIRSHTAKNYMDNALYQELLHIRDKMPPQLQQQADSVLKMMLPQLEQAHMQNIAKAVVGSHQGGPDSPLTFSGPTNDKVLEALKLFNPKIGVPASQEADRVAATRKQFDAYKDAFRKLNTATAGQTGETLGIASKMLEGITSHVPVASLAGKFVGAGGSLAEKFQQYRNAVRAQVGPDFPEDLLPNIHDTAGDRSQKLRSAAVLMKQREGRTPMLDLLQSRGTNVVAPSPYDEYLSPKGGGAESKKGDGKATPKKKEETSSGPYQGLVDALKGKSKDKVAK